MMFTENVLIQNIVRNFATENILIMKPSYRKYSYEEIFLFKILFLYKHLAEKKTILIHRFSLQKIFYTGEC